MRYVLIRDTETVHFVPGSRDALVSYGGGSFSSDDEDEEVGGWLSQSTFGLGRLLLTTLFRQFHQWPRRGILWHGAH